MANTQQNTHTSNVASSGNTLTDIRTSNVTSSNVTLFRIDPPQKMRRYYNTDIQPNLFGGHSLIRTWGRIGITTQSIIQLFDTKKEATSAQDKLLRQKRRRGYG